MSTSRQLALGMASNVLAAGVVAAVALALQDLALLLAGLLLVSCGAASWLALLLRSRTQSLGELTSRTERAEAERDTAQETVQRYRQRAEAEAGFRAMDEELYGRVVDGCLRLLRGQSVSPSTFAGLEDETQAELRRAADRVQFEQTLRSRMRDTAIEN